MRKISVKTFINPNSWLSFPSTLTFHIPSAKICSLKCVYTTPSRPRPPHLLVILSPCNEIIASNENALHSMSAPVHRSIMNGVVGVRGRAKSHVKKSSLRVTVYLSSAYLRLRRVVHDEDDEKLPIKLKQLGLIVPINIVFPMDIEARMR
jgi:hypothetical protein